jgi:hypothetical protein
MSIVKTITDLLKQAQPFILMVALLFGFAAAWGAFAEWLPVLKQIWSGKGNPQTNAIIGPALAIIAGRA